jgi:hypothetical protein
MKTPFAVIVSMGASLCGIASGSMLSGRLVDAHERFLDDRREALSSLSDPFGVPPVARRVIESPTSNVHLSGWKRDVIATVFWVGELPTQNNPTPNTKSAWDANWQENFGGYDDPDQRAGYFPARFIPQLNPFYVALPYNDVAPGGVHRPEASEVIPWFWKNYKGDGISVCKGQWIAIHYQGRVCYGQWEDVGPFETDHWAYVFGQESPRPNRNQSAGIDIAPAIRDYLKVRSGSAVDWRFVDETQVPAGPWQSWTKLYDPTANDLPRASSTRIENTKPIKP